MSKSKGFKYTNVVDDIITLKGVFKTRHKVQPAFDPNTSWYKGVKRLSETDKRDEAYVVRVGETGENAKFNTTIDLFDGIEFNMRVEVDRVNWEWVKELKEVADSFESALESPSARFYKVEEGREAKQKNKNYDLTYEATKFVMEDSPSDYYDRALILGNNMEGEIPLTVRQYLLDLASNTKTAQKVIDSYTSKSLSLQLLYLKAKAKGIITETKNGAIKFGPQVLSMSDDGAIAFLQDKSNLEVVELLQREVNPEYFGKKDEKSDEDK